MDINDIKKKGEEIGSQIQESAKSKNFDLNKIKNTSDNFYSKALFVLGWVIIVLGVIGTISMTSNAGYGAGLTIFLVGLLTTALSGFLILGLSEIISLLNENKKLLSSIANGQRLFG